MFCPLCLISQAIDNDVTLDFFSKRLSEQIEREREIETERGTDRHTNNQTDRHTGKKKE